MKIREAVNRYDRSIMTVAIAIATLGTIYMKIDDIMSKMVDRTTSIQELKNSKLIQNGINHEILNKLTEIKDEQREIKRLLYRVKRGLGDD